MKILLPSSTKLTFSSDLIKAARKASTVEFQAEAQDNDADDDVKRCLGNFNFMCLCFSLGRDTHVRYHPE